MPDATTFPSAIKRKVLETRHPSLDIPYLARLRALYEGGYSLLHNPAVLESLSLGIVRRPRKSTRSGAIEPCTSRTPRRSSTSSRRAWPATQCE